MRQRKAVGIYAAEMSAAEKKENTPLSNTNYFNASIADYIEYNDRDLTSLTVKESPKENSPYVIEADYVTHRKDNAPFWMPGDKEYDLIRKTVKIETKVWHHDIEIKIHHQYIVFREGKYKGAFREFGKEAGLYIYYSASNAGKELTSFEDFSSLGISEAELREQSEEELNKIFHYWVDNYSESKFKNNDFGEYVIIENMPISHDDRIKVGIELTI